MEMNWNSGSTDELKLDDSQYDEMFNLSCEILERLEKAVRDGTSPETQEGRAIAALHKKWLKFAWKDYSADIHKELSLRYPEEQRYLEFYDKNVGGCATFLSRSIQTFCDEI